MRRNVDDVAGRGIDQLSVQTDRHPEHAIGRVDCVDLLGIIGIAEDMYLLEDAVGQPDFLAVLGDRDAVAGTAMGNTRPRRTVPHLAPVDAGHLHRLQDLACPGVGDDEPHEVVLVDIDSGRILVQHLNTDIVGKLDLADDLGSGDIGNLQQLAVGRHEGKLAVCAEVEIMHARAAGGVDDRQELSGPGIKLVPVILQVRAHDEGLAIDINLRPLATFSVQRGRPHHLVGRQVDRPQPPAGGQI